MAEKVALQPIKTKASEELRFYSRRVSQEDTSSDAYYREKSVGVPFLWESQPGTPKMRTREFQLPPLTPPPSFHASPISRKPTTKLRLMFLPKKHAQFDYSSASSTDSTPPRLSYDSRVEDDDCDSPLSTLCFRARARRRPRPRGCSSRIISILLGES